MGKSSQGFAYILLLAIFVPVAIAITFVAKNIADKYGPLETKPSELEEREISPSLFKQILEKGKGAFVPTATPESGIKPTPTSPSQWQTRTQPTPTPISTPTPTPTQPPQQQPTTGSIEGIVRTASGEPHRGNVELYCDCSHLRHGATDSTSAGEDGYYRFDDILAGEYRIQGFYGNWSKIYNVSVTAGQTTTFDVYLTSDPAKVPETAIVSGPTLRTNPGDPDNFYCTTVRITVQDCCVQLKVAMAYDDTYPQYISLTQKCPTSHETYICKVLSSGPHTFYYHSWNQYCGEESLKSVNFTVP